MAAVFMHLDVGTLSVVTVFVMALLGALLLFAGVQNRTIRAPLWWGAAQLAGAGGLGLTTPSGVLPAFVSIDIANALVLLAYGLTWAGARDFDGRNRRGVVARTRGAVAFPLAYGHRSSCLRRRVARAHPCHVLRPGARHRLIAERAFVRADRIRYASLHRSHVILAAEHDQGTHRAAAQDQRL